MDDDGVTSVISQNQKSPHKYRLLQQPHANIFSRTKKKANLAAASKEATEAAATARFFEEGKKMQGTLKYALRQNSDGPAMYSVYAPPNALETWKKLVVIE